MTAKPQRALPTPLAPLPDFHSQAFHADPFASLAAVRAESPVYYLEAEFAAMWLITGFEEASEALRDPRLSAGAARHVAVRPGSEIFERLMPEHLLNSDPPDHTRLRRLISQAFTPRFVEQRRTRIQALADELIDAVASRGAMDFVADFALPLPIIVIAELLGVPATDRDLLKRWSELVFRALSRPASDDDLAQAERFAAYIDQLVSKKRAAPEDDLISRMVTVEDEGSRLSDREILSMIVLLIFAGHETTAKLLSNSLLALLSTPDQLALLTADPARIPAAVEELLRVCGPVLGVTPRFALEPIELGGQTINPGEMVMVCVGAANHDPQAFARPDQIDFERPAQKHLAFGRGIHFCVGAPLARLEAEIALATLLRRLPNIRLACAPHELAWEGNISLRGPVEIPVRF